VFRDGPLTRKAPETIRYGTGRCALGALLVASSEQGIVSIMVRDSQQRLIRDLHKTAVIVTHDARIYHFADRIFRMQAGQLHDASDCLVPREKTSLIS
jgi:ABC-type dipeptide/oligopeptide/nickel transport system ATPase subunit